MLIMSSRVEIYPREGTETILLHLDQTECHVEIYPREGTETILHPSFQCFTCVEIYPREGTETNRMQQHRLRCTLKFIPVRGRKPVGSKQVCK